MAENNPQKSKGISRREFLKGIGSGAVGTAILSTGGLLPREVKAELLEPEIEQLSGAQRIELLVNGVKRQVTVEPRTTLLTVLRTTLRLTGTKQACDRGQCGACTVLVDEKPVLSCMLLALDMRGKAILTIEGIGTGKTLTAVQQAFVEKDGLMCGFCTPGFVVTATALLKQNPNPTLEEIKQGLAGNLCRCGTYPKVFEAVQAAAKTGKNGGSA